MKDIKILTLNKKNISDFALERNLLLKKSSSLWNIFLDTDEKLVEKTQKIDTNYVAFTVKRNNYFLQSFVGSEQLIRLIKKGSGKWVRKVHERFVVKNGKVGESGILIEHNTAHDLKSYINKINLYSSLHATANKAEGKNVTLLKIVLYPIFKFVQTYLKSKNVVFSIMQSLHSYLSWAKYYLN